jgi:1-phosphofructokinase
MLITITPNPVLDKTITVKHIRINEMSRAIAIQEDWGGKGFNVSRALRAMNVDSLVMGFIGGATGQKLQRGLESLGIPTELVPIQGDTRTNIVITEEKGSRYVKVNESGPELLPEEINTLLIRLRQRIRPGDLCALCGSLPPGVPDNFYADMISLIQNTGARAFLDTSGTPLQAGLVARPYLVKPNASEAAVLTGQIVRTPAEGKAAVQAFLDAGAEAVALSLGAEGMILGYTRDAEVFMLRAKPPQVPILNPTGAGDALLAGILYALDKKWTMRDLACWAVASGTAAAMGEGVSVGKFAEIKALASQVTTSDEWSGDE